jgi:hypothetical protein
MGAEARRKAEELSSEAYGRRIAEAVTEAADEAVSGRRA